MSLQPSLFSVNTRIAFVFFLCALLLNVLSSAEIPRGQMLGPTGMQGDFRKNDIVVTHVIEQSPASGKIEPGAVIIGAGSKKFSNDLRSDYAAAIDAAETEEAGGRLVLMLSGNKEVELNLEVLGSYSQIAPYQCPKTELIIERAADFLSEQIEESLSELGRFNSGATHTAMLGLLATGERKYINVAAQAIKESDLLYPDEDLIEAQLAGEHRMGYVGWYWGYNCILLGEYYMLTRDRTALDALEVYAVALAKGQDAGGLWGHRMAVNGRLPGYAQMNQSSLSCFLGMLIARKCGIDDPDLNAGIAKTYAYYATYIGKGGFNYGVHGPDSRRFNNNGMSGLAALCMSLLGDQDGTRFFAGLSATAYETLEQGHASNFFNPLWTPLGASLAGPEITHHFFMNSLWLHTNYRAWNGSFYRYGVERGKEGSQTGVALLTYCLPRKALFITGKEQDPSLWLKGGIAKEVIEMSQLDYGEKGVDELLALFDFPFPQARIRAVRTLRDRGTDFVPEIVELLEQGNKLQRMSALEYFGAECRPDQAYAIIEKIGAILRNKGEDSELRAKAASTLSALGSRAHVYYNDMLQLIVDEEADDPFRDIDQSLSRSLNQLSSTPYGSGLITDEDLFYAAASKLLVHKRQHARSEGIKMLSEIPITDFKIMADQIIYIIEDEDRTYHSYHGWQHTIGPAIKILANLNIEEGIDYALGVLDRKGGKWGFKVRMVCAALPPYGANAKDALAQLRADERLEGVETSKFSWPWNNMVKAIEQDKEPERLISLEEALELSGI